MPLSFGYRAVENLVFAEVSMQLARSAANEAEVLNIPIIMGGVGVGKTSIANNVAARLAYDTIKINCGECADPSEFGMPVPFHIKETEHAFMPWVLNRALHEACERPVVLFFDDIDKSPSLVEGALIGVFGERKVRDRKLHKETVVIAAGNRVQDDALARHLSESMRTRGTIVHLDARFDDFAAYARKNPEKVHPNILGFLAYKPAMLHKHDMDADRFPTPRSWVEASSYLHHYKHDADIAEDKSNAAWRTMISLKCGEPAANDFYAWWSIVARIDVQKLLKTGQLEHTLTEREDEAVVSFAAVFAVAQALNTTGAKKEHKGLMPFLESLHMEHKVALLTQLTAKARAKVATAIPESAGVMLSDIVPLGD